MPPNDKEPDPNRRRRKRDARAGKGDPSSRGFGLSERDLARLKSEVQQRSTGKRTYVPNPHNKGVYHFVIETLKALGINRAHPAAVVTAKFRELTNTPDSRDAKGATFWKRWTRGDENASPWKERFAQNVEVLQRVPRGGVKTNNTPYGRRLLEVGTKVLGTRGVVIDILRDRDGLRKYRLNTDSDSPINQFRTRRDGSRRATEKRFTSEARVKQKGKCGICDRNNRPLCLDHCHQHNHLRGLLCGPCNSGLGFFGDSPELLLKAALYLMARGKPPVKKAKKGPK